MAISPEDKSKFSDLRYRGLYMEKPNLQLTSSNEATLVTERTYLSSHDEIDPFMAFKKEIESSIERLTP